MLPYVLFDAGWTLLFPNHHKIGQVIRRHVPEVDEERLQRLIAEIVRGIDEQLRCGQPPNYGLFAEIAARAGISPENRVSAVKELETIDATHSLWNLTFPWVEETLAGLSRTGYRMSVISNASGHVAEQLGWVGLARYLERIYDSFVVGYSKPDVRLFRHALDDLGLRPEDCLYVGDMYFVDVLGANRAGIAAVHLDRYGLYGDWPGCRIPSVAELPDLLARDGLDLRDGLYFPLREWRVMPA